MALHALLVGDEAGQIKSTCLDFQLLLDNNGTAVEQGSPLIPTTSPVHTFHTDPPTSIKRIKLVGKEHFLCLRSDGELFFVAMDNSFELNVCKAKWLASQPVKVVDFSCLLHSSVLHILMLANKLIYCKIPLVLLTEDSEDEPIEPSIMEGSIPSSAVLLSAMWNEAYIEDSIFAIGGDQCPLHLYKLDNERLSMRNIFRASEEKCNELAFVPRISIVGIVFFGVSSSLVAIATAQKELRFYDYMASSSEPVFSKIVSDHRITGLYYSARTRSVVGITFRMLSFTDIQGGISLFDERTRKPFGRLKDHVGAVKDILCPESLPVLVSIGLDRCLRVYSLFNKKLLVSVYFNRRLASLSDVFKPDAMEQQEKTESSADEKPGSDNDADVWEIFDALKSNN